MQWNSSETEEKLNRQRQLEENRQSTKNAFTDLVHTNLTDIASEANITLMNESFTVSERQQVSTFDHTSAAESRKMDSKH